LNSLILLFLVKLPQSQVALVDIKLDIGLHFPEADAAKVHGFAGTLLQVVAAVHDALVVDAVTHSEHMSHLVGHHSHRAVFYQPVVYLVRLLSKKTLIVAGKREHACSFADARQSKDEIPLLPRIEVSRAHANQAEGIRRQLALQDCQNVSGIVLLLLSIRVDSAVDSLR
jgi:hypothetical protein